MIKPHNDNTLQALRSWSVIHHHPHRCILSLDQAKHHKPITCILDLTLHQIFNTCTLGLMIFSSFYSFRPFSIPWTKTTWDQYLGPNTLDQYHGSKYHGPNTMDQKLSFPTCTRFPSCESACVRYTHLLVCKPVCIRLFVKVNLSIPLFLHSLYFDH